MTYRDQRKHHRRKRFLRWKPGGVDLGNKLKMSGQYLQQQPVLVGTLFPLRNINVSRKGI